MTKLEELRRKPRAMPPNAMLEQTEPVYRRKYNLMGEPLLFQTNDRALLEAAEDGFGGFGQVAGTKESHSEAEFRDPLVLTVFVHDLGTETPAHRDYYQLRPIHRTHYNLYYVSLGAQNTGVVDLTHGRAFGFVAPDLVKDRLLVRHVFLEGLAIAMLGPARHFLGWHSACVVKDDLGVVLYGDAGRGKSTLAYACARRGYQVLAEDGVFLGPGPVTPRLWGMPWRLHLLPDSRLLFPELAGEEPKLQINGEWKLELEMEELMPGSTTTNAAPGLVLFLERGDGAGPTRTEILTSMQAQERFELVWPWWVGWTEEMEERIPCLWEQGAYQLWMNGSPDSTVDAIDALLDDLF